MWLSGAKVVLPDRVLPVASVRLEGGRVAEVREGRAPGGLSLQGLTLVPGVVDLHGDTLERDLEPRPGVRVALEVALEAWEARMLAAGITTAFAAIAFWEGAGGVRAPEESLEIARGLCRLRGSLALDLRIHARYEVARPLGEWAVRAALEEGLVHLLSFMDHTPGQGQFRDLETYLAYMSRWLGRSQEEVAADVASRRVAWHALEGLAAEARQKGVVLASHDDDTPERVALMERLGVGVSEFPLTLEAAREAKRRGMWVVMGAPNALRGGSHNGNLSALEALRAGHLDALATDYQPGSALRAAFALAARGLLPLPRAVGLTSLHPAQAAGLPDRGAILPGFRGDLVALKEEPFQVVGVWVAGKPALLRGHFWRWPLVEIRPLRREDLPQVAALLRLLDPEGDEPPRLEAAWEALGACPWGQAYVAVRSGEVVATYTLYVLPNLGHGGKPFAVMESVAVAEEAQGQGIGSLLVRHAVAEARRKGAYKLALSSALHREKAHRFYEKLGFRVYGISLGLELS